MVSCIPSSRLEWAYLGAIAAQAIVITAIQTTVLVRYLQWVNSVAYQVSISFVTPLSIGITLLGVVYQLILTLDAYRIKNNIQIFVHCICNVCLSVATVMQYGQIKHARDRILVNTDRYGTPFAKYEYKFWENLSPALITCNVTSCLCSVVVCSLAYFISREFSWKVYQQVSPDREVRRRYSLYQIYLVLLKFTPFFIITFIIVYDIIDVHYVQPEFALTLAIIPAALIHVGLAVYFVRHETRIGMAFVLLGHAAEMAWLISRLMILYGDSLLAATLMKDEMTLLASVALAFSSIATAVGAVCFFNFRRGLKPLLLGQLEDKNRTTPFDQDYQFQLLNHNVVAAPSLEQRRFDLD